MNLTLDSSGWTSLFKGALVASVGAGLTYVLQNMAGVTFGGLPTEVVVALMSVGVNYVRKALGLLA